MEHQIAEIPGSTIVDGISRNSGQDPTPSRILAASREMGIVETGGVLARGLPSHLKLDAD